MNLSDEDQAETVDTGRSRIVSNIDWARTYMGQAGLLESPSRGVWVISDKGREWMQKFPHEPLNSKVLLALSEKFQIFMRRAVIYQTFPIKEFTPELLHRIRDNIKEFRLKQPSYDSSVSKETVDGAQTPEPQNDNNDTIDEMTPEESLGSIYELYREKIIALMKAEFESVHFGAFEQMIVDVLTKCGYGHKGLNKTTAATRDKGIDGIIFEDKFGLGKIGIQVKRYTSGSPVGSPEINNFIGALAAGGYSKGIFVTSSTFTKDAISLISNSRSNTSIVLIDGEQLAKIMLEHDIGIHIKQTIKIIDVDQVFFGRYADRQTL